MSLDGVSLLVLEDDQDTRELLATSLSKVGAEVRTAVTVEQALIILDSWRPSAILCDLHLPVLDGYAFLELVRDRKRYDNIPLIAISASHPSVEREKSLEAGFATHLTKPSKLSEIIAAVTKLVAVEIR